MAIKQEELRNHRLVTGETNPMNKTALPVIGCIPLQVAKTGQFTTTDIEVMGDSSALFLTEFQKGMYLYSASLNELRKIEGITANDRMIIEFPFSADIAAVEDCYVVEAKYASVVTKNTGGSDALVQEVTLPSGEVDIRDFDLTCAPFSYNAQTSTLMFHISE